MGYDIDKIRDGIGMGVALDIMGMGGYEFNYI